MTCQLMQGKTGYKGQKYVVYATFSLGNEPPAEHVFGWQNEPRGGLLEAVRLNPSMKNGRIEDLLPECDKCGMPLTDDMRTKLSSINSICKDMKGCKMRVRTIEQAMGRTKGRK